MLANNKSGETKDKEGSGRLLSFGGSRAEEHRGALHEEPTRIAAG